MADTAVDFLLEYLKKLMMNCKEIEYNQFPEVEKQLQIQSVYEDLSSLRTFLNDSEMIWYKLEEVKDVVIRITDMANEAQDIIDSSIVDDFIKSVHLLEYRSFTSGMLINLPNEIESLKKVVSDLYAKKVVVRCNLSLRASVDSVLEYLNQLMDFMVFDDELEACFLDLSSFRTTFPGDSSQMRWYKHEELKDLLTRITDKAKEAEACFLDLSSFRTTFLGDSSQMSWYKCVELKDLVTRITDKAKEAEIEMDFSYSVCADTVNEAERNKYSSYSEWDEYPSSIDKELEYPSSIDKYLSIYGHQIEEARSGIFVNLQKGIDSLREEAHGIKNPHKTSNSSSPRASIDSMLAYLERLMNYTEICNQFTEVKKLHNDVISFRFSSSQYSEELRWYEHKKLLNLMIQVTNVAKEVKEIIDVESDIIEKNDSVPAWNFSHVYQSGMLNNVLKEIESVKEEVSQIYQKKWYGIGDPHVRMYSGESLSSCTSSSSRVALSIVEEEETVIGFDNDVETIRERLDDGCGSKQLDIISIVGMAGLGKTTLAKKLYNDPFVVYHFYIRGWTYVSQVYAKRDLLISILSSVVENRDGLHTMNDEKLGEELYKRLKGKRYLIVMDDMWDTKAWNDMRIYFPNDNNGSRIIITSRLTEVALHAKPECPPHLLHLLTEDESWDLLKQKVFGKESCTPDLSEIGEKIAHKCQGLPLAIVVVAGLLSRTDKKKEEWEKVARSLSSHIGTDLEQCMNNTLELSYYHLPRHLRLCFLYFGAFPEDYEICVRKVTWLWIAEGFIHQTGHKTLEDVAEEFLMDLIDRSLVLVAKRKFSGGIRACRVHDLLRDLCQRKGKEENFMQQIYVHETLSSNLSYPSSCLNPIKEKQRRLCIFSNALEYISLKHCAPHIRSLLSFFPIEGSLRRKEFSCGYPALKLLRVLDLSAILRRNFPSEILQLVLLRYLEIRVTFHFTLPKSISNLLNLEMLHLSSPKGSGVHVPYSIWTMVNLRHLRIDAGCKDFFGNKGYPSVLHNLQTILYLLPSMSCQEILERTPNLKKLGFCGCFQWNLRSPNLHSFNHLETLKLLNRERISQSSRKWSLQDFKFPPNLRRLTLSNTNLDWEDMSTLGMLCNLEVLKLEYSACVGQRWETTSEGFGRLKFLRLRHINIEQWEASNTDFPSLQQLVLQGCLELEGIPLDFGNIPTLQTIEVTRCSQSTENSARIIQEEQQDMGNDCLKILINS